MASKGRVARALSVVFSGGALGASLVLALSSTEASAEANPAATPQSAAAGSVSERLRAIRAGVDDLRSQAGPGSADPQQRDESGARATWWGNGGWGRWHMGWGNGGWGWPNWHNWGNGWHNFWHNW